MSDKSEQIYQLIPKVMADIGAIGKGRKNAQQGYAFRGIDDVYNAIQPALVKHGVFICPTVIDHKREERPTRDGKGTLIYTVLTVKHTVFAPDGSHIEAVTVGEAMDSGDKSANKAMSAAMKYALIELFSIPTEGDNDADAGSPQPAAKPREVPSNADGANRVAALLKEVQMPKGWEAAMLKRAGVASWAQMPADKIQKTIDLLNDKKQSNGKAAIANG